MWVEWLSSSQCRKLLETLMLLVVDVVLASVLAPAKWLRIRKENTSRLE